MSNPYATVADFKRHSNMPEDTTRDAMIEEALDAAAATWERICGRRFKADTTASAKTASSNGERDYVYCPEEFVEVTQVEVYESSAWSVLAASSWEAFRGDPLEPSYTTPYHGIVLTGTGRLYFPKKVRVTAKWGYAVTPPAQIVTAVVAQAHIWYKAAESSWSDTGGGVNFGQLFYKMSVDHHLKLMLVEAKLVRPTI